ncbi:MAG TPA: OmpA family protein [Saprospiraceae bacterium]|nr:OmpA family protein [Saprospiraceae bacterium]MCO5283309.1 OmpA family protein [Saprospiraceae bacterium]WKZ63396.1 MAG: OmpA family protein [Saprospiraceae bacterium]HNK08110.1 OmpA family protein [Saprospiraceae bacterium]HNK70755.1 OmpA family protein [Saprospiraceae bacterium]
MINRNFFNLFLPVLFVSFLSSCVPYRSLDDQKAKTVSAENARARIQVEYDKVKSRYDSLQIVQIQSSKTIDFLRRDTAMANSSLRNYMNMDAENKKRMEQLSRTTDRILDANVSENERLIAQVKTQKEDLLRQKEELERKQAAFEVSKSEFYKAQNELNAQDQKIRELQAALEKKDVAVKELRQKVADALVGFQASGLTVAEKDGKVYVLLPEALLFKSGSKNIDGKGKEALNQLASILRTNPDINIVVEGHTDNVPYKPKSSNSMVEDNWDLSVLRATSVVKVLTAVGISPLRISAQGRGEFMPVNPGNSSDAKTANRRTEIILSPKLDELLKTLN